MYSDFFEQEFSTLSINDSRLTRRAIKIGKALIKSPGSCIQEVFDCKNEARCAYDFFSNPKIKWQKLYDPHQNQTVERIKTLNDEHIFIIQDSTFFNYTSHKAKMDLGNIGKQGRFTQLGFLQHTALCISSDEMPLGILELDFIGYEDDPEIFAYRKKFENIASSRWRRFFAENKNRLQTVNKTIITLCDREADFFEFLSDFKEEKQFKFIIRSKWNRSTGPSSRQRKNKFSELFKKTSDLGEIMLTYMDPHTHKEISDLFHVKSLQNIILPPTHRGAGHKQNKLPPLVINLVQVSNDESQWVLLTNLPVSTLQEATFVIQSYKKRWHIESFHKVLKTAYRAEQVYLHQSRETIQNLLTMINLAACQTYWLIQQARAEQSLSATTCFQPQEIEALHLFYFHKLPNNLEAVTL